MTVVPVEKVSMSDPARPPVFIHVGAPKSGTTYLQRKLWHNREALRRDGFLYPGAQWASHVWATLDLRKIKFKGVTDPNAQGAWAGMVDEIRAFGGPAIISHELLSATTPNQIARAMQDLSFADVHVVYTLRDMARTLPAAWQEWVKNRETEDFAEFLAAVHEPAEQRSRTGQLFWNLHDTRRALEKWGADLPPGNVHVITVPPAGSDPAILWRRFATLLGIDADRYEEDRDASNASLAAPEASVMRMLNVELGGWDFPWPVYDTVVKHHLSVELARRPGPSIALPADEYAWAVQWSHDTAAFITDAGFDVIGDAAELDPAAPRNGIDPDHADSAAQAQAAVAGMATLVRYIAGEGDSGNAVRIGELEFKLQRAEEELRRHRDLPPGERVKRCAVELADQVGWLGATYRGYRTLRRRGR